MAEPVGKLAEKPAAGRVIIERIADHKWSMRELLVGVRNILIGFVEDRHMHGVPADLDLAFLRGSELIQLCLGQFQIQFNFHPIGNISVEGEWEFFDAAGNRIDESYDKPDRPPYQLHRLLGQQVVDFEVAPPDWFSIRFEGGEVLRVFDNSKQYESFSIQPGNIFI